MNTSETNVIAPEFIEAGARSLAGDFDYLSQWGEDNTNYSAGYWRELFTRAVEAGNAALTATNSTGGSDG